MAATVTAAVMTAGHRKLTGCPKLSEVDARMASMTDGDVRLLVASVPAAAAITAAIVGVLATYIHNKSSRRREMYGQAIRSVVGWTEMPHRVRRRGDDEGPGLRERFHQLQEELACHRGLIGSESKYVERSYIRLVAAAKRVAKEPIRVAWADPGEGSPDEELDLSSEIAAFLRDVRAHLSPWPWQKLALSYRNRQGL